MHERLLAAVGNRTYRNVGELTGIHPETVRRYLSGQTPSVEFIASLSRALNISADWLLTGSGPMKVEEVRAHTLAHAEPGELLKAVSGTMERLIDRVDRIEIYMQSLEARLRAQQMTDGESSPGSPLLAQPARIPRATVLPVGDVASAIETSVHHNGGGS